MRDGDKGKETMQVNVHGCARCGVDHEMLRFLPLRNAPDEWQWFALCPNTQQPVMLKVDDDSVWSWVWPWGLIAVIIVSVIAVVAMGLCLSLAVPH